MLPVMSPTVVLIWVIEPTKDGDYELVVQSRQAFTELSWETSTNKGQANKQSGTKELTLTIPMTKKDEKVQVTLKDDTKTFGPYTVTVTFKGK